MWDKLLDILKYFFKNFFGFLYEKEKNKPEDSKAKYLKDKSKEFNKELDKATRERDPSAYSRIWYAVVNKYRLLRKISISSKGDGNKTKG